MDQAERQDYVDRRLEDLVSYPREDLEIEIKGWLDLGQEEDKANMAQAILAIANHGGGYVLIGFTLEEGMWKIAEPRPTNLNGYTQDIINGIVQKYAEPPFHCVLYFQRDSISQQVFPIIMVPGNHKVPIRSKRDGPDRKHILANNYYIRRPGPKSETPQSGREWDELINRCIRAARDDLLENIRSLLFGPVALPRIVSPREEAKRKLEDWTKQMQDRFDGLIKEKLPTEAPSRYSRGTWIVAYAIIGDFNPPSLGDLFKILVEVEGHETGWPPWWVPSREEIKPYPYNGNLECWLAPNGRFADVAHSDFWCASPDGMMFLVRGYQEDADYPNPGTIFDLILPVWRVGECLLHAERFANKLSDHGLEIFFRVCWCGLQDRTLTSWANPQRILFGDRKSKQDSVVSEISVSAERISPALPEIVAALTRPVYEVFALFKPSSEMIQEELLKMRGRTP